MISEVRKNFGRIVREAENGVTVEVTRWGKPIAVLLGIDASERMAPRRSTRFWEAYERFLQKHDLSDLDRT
jgi:prevent-host-death family protein